MSIVILSFGNAVTEDIWNGTENARVRKFGADVLKAAGRKLDMLDAAHVLQDLRVPPGNHLELLAGDLEGFHAIRVNDQWRIVFRWDQGSARDVKLIDYH